jgi:UDP-N-acetylglucosamine--N-acetylmuramyl-(pentapeptide) pyrophosphoryl-undecaprenol N-acetylglucosamine transferase
LRRLYFTPYGVGLGHASRLLVLANKLKELGCESRFSSFGEAKNYLNIHGYECNSIPPVEFLWKKDGEFSVKQNITKIPRWLINVPIQINKEISYLKKFNPNIIISDSRLSSLVAGKILNIPTILLINQIKLLLTPALRKYQIVKFFETCFGEFMGGLWNISDQILIPDLPPPYTISENNIWGTHSVKKKINYVGFISPKKNMSQQQVTKVSSLLNFSNNKPIVFFHISGPSKTRLPLVRKILEAQKYFKNKIQYVISEGKPNGKVEPLKLSDNGWYYEWCPIRDELFIMSNILVLRGGHTTISQAIQFGKPIISIPIENHAEQISNSRKITKIGIGIMLKPNDLTSEKLMESINKLLNDTKFLSKSNEIMEFCSKLNGVQNVINIIRSYI